MAIAATCRGLSGMTQINMTDQAIRRTAIVTGAARGIGAGVAGRVDYAAAKAGLIGFTKSLALRLGQHGVTANAIGPGFVVSDMTRVGAQRRGRSFEEHQRIVAQTIPVRRVGQPEDIAHTASYLVSPEAGFVSVQVVYVAGGPVD
ncbi:SDR family oxidoreductase [Micromonospora lupini]|uniref:SDR family oxidoreductase n=1 Tax=Micromonospora lupini TaxID=285679 RepID=UPI0031DF960D